MSNDLSTQPDNLTAAERAQITREMETFRVEREKAEDSDAERSARMELREREVEGFLQRVFTPDRRGRHALHVLRRENNLL